MKRLLVAAMVLASGLHGAQDLCVTHLVVPSYPRLARMAQLQGSVTVAVEVNTRGGVTSAKASGPSKLLERASEENVKQWSFSPASDVRTASAPRHATITLTSTRSKVRESTSILRQL